MSAPDVTFEVFTKPNCPACQATLRLLDKLGAVYETADALKNIDELRARGFGEAPVVSVFRPGHGGLLDEFSGFRPDRLKAHLSSSGGKDAVA